MNGICEKIKAKAGKLSTGEARSAGLIKNKGGNLWPIPSFMGLIIRMICFIPMAFAWEDKV